MRDSNEPVHDDSQLGTTSGALAHPGPGVFKRSASERTFCHLQQMEKNYSKLGDRFAKVKENSNGNGMIKVASLSSIDFHRNKDHDIDTDHFAGRRDVSNPTTINEKRIVSSRGSVRGFKNRVRAGIATFIEQNGFSQRNYRQEEKGKIIVYTTSMTVVREAADKCKAVRNMLQTHMVRYEERDMFMSAENQKELTERLGLSAIRVPQVFADGVYIGDYDEVHKLNDTGELRSMFKNFTKIQVRSSCDKCGGYRYLPCTFCHGSKKSLHRNEFTEEFCALRCMQCDENGLMRCDECIDQQE
ncbi:glutaredoxin domain-containing cysteine-rich protein CG31559-like isoform X2 [Mercenaria mercenaria]|uniref:glutaredoxin domain-containing cysteine-rich protein CG31559-like isoform X2 n=1 Tax=Mercenaria mercenaria TaxID=6596 RepID=UPI001E1DDABA|nr:glutaredoxin domain-containing cysteine-rich protein CG31559-like isoform X2 [Mercenaria mercenaria]